VAVLADALRDGADKVRRRAAATLGELLFYIAMQPPARRPAPALATPPRAPPDAVRHTGCSLDPHKFTGRTACAPCPDSGFECALACAPAHACQSPTRAGDARLAGAGLARAPGPCRVW